MAIQAAEISAILKDQIKNFGQDAEVAEVGRVLSVGDGIARVYGLDNVQAGEMVEFPGGIRGMALNLERDWDGAAANKWLQQTYDDLKRARREQGWDIHAVERYEDLLDFARAFSRRHYV